MGIKGEMSVKLNRWLRDFFWQHKYSYLIGFILMFMASYSQTLFPEVLGQIIDLLGVTPFDETRIWQLIGVIVLIALMTFTLMFSWRLCIIRNVRLLECRLRERLFEHFQTLGPSFYTEHKTGDLIAYGINDLSAVRMMFGPATAMSMNGISLCLISIYSMANAIDWRLTFMCLLPIPIIVFFMLKIGTLIRRRFLRVQKLFAGISDRVQENIYGIRVIKAYVQEDSELQKFECLNEEMLEANIEMVKISALLSPTIELCFCVSFVLNLIIGGKMVLNGEITLGDFVAFNTYLTMIMNPVISIGRIINIIQRGLASCRRLEDIFAVQSDVLEPLNPITKGIEGEIKFNEVTFTYPGAKKPALQQINLRIQKGQSIGVVGKTGAGKTTLANLLLRLYPIEAGGIFIDDMDVNHYSLKTLRGACAYVPQEHYLFSATIKENIMFFKDDYSDEEMKQACAMSCIDQSILKLEKGYETILGERGVNLSGGQKQRLSIARALIQKPSILILDDSLSAVDSMTEQHILTQLKQLKGKQTTLIISHKLSSVKLCDQIIVLDEGRIIERGTHEELLEKGGVYHELYEEQSSE